MFENLYNSLANWRGEALEEVLSATVLVQEKKSATQNVKLRVSCPRLSKPWTKRRECPCVYAREGHAFPCDIFFTEYEGDET